MFGKTCQFCVKVLVTPRIKDWEWIGGSQSMPNLSKGDTRFIFRSNPLKWIHFHQKITLYIYIYTKTIMFWVQLRPWLEVWTTGCWGILFLDQPTITTWIRDFEVFMFFLKPRCRDDGENIDGLHLKKWPKYDDNVRIPSNSWVFYIWNIQYK